MSFDIKVRCNNCDRYIPVKAVKSSEVEIRCGDRKCKQWQTIKVLMLSDLAGANK